MRILCAHPHVTISALTSESYAGQEFSSVYPGYLQRALPQLEPLVPEKIAAKADIVFTALPHKEAMRVVPALIKSGKRVIDLSADFRFKNQKTYERWYQEHSAPRPAWQRLHTDCRSCIAPRSKKPSLWPTRAVTRPALSCRLLPCFARD